MHQRECSQDSQEEDTCKPDIAQHLQPQGTGELCGHAAAGAALLS